MTEKNGITEGVIWKQLLIFFFPIFLGTIFQQFYNVADAIIVGRFVGKEALGAIDTTGGLTKLFINFFTGLSAGATVVISQQWGAKNDRGISKSVHTAIAFAVIGGGIIAVIGIIFTPQFLSFMNVPDDIMKFASDYARIYFSGTIALLVYNMGSGVLRAIGDSKRPFYYLIVCCVLNIILDVIFVAIFRWKVVGAAVATVLSQLVSAILVLAALIRSNEAYRLIPNRIRIHGKTLKQMIRIGLPVGVQGSLYSVSNIVIQSSINTFGTDTVAAWGICGKLEFLIWTLMDAFGLSISTFAAQNYGAKKYDRVRKSVSVCIWMAMFITLTLCVPLYMFGEQLSKLFVDDENVIKISAQMIRLLAPFFATYIFGEVMSGAIRGSGEAFKPMILTLIGTCGLRVLWILFAVPFNPTIEMVIASYPFTWIATSVMFIVYYARGRWLKIEAELSF